MVFHTFRTWTCICGIPRSAHQITHFPVLGCHLLHYARHYWFGHSGRFINGMEMLCRFEFLYNTLFYQNLVNYLSEFLFYFQFGMFECLISGFVDTFPTFLLRKKTLFTGAVCCLQMLLGLPLVTKVTSQTQLRSHSYLYPYFYTCLFL